MKRKLNIDEQMLTLSRKDGTGGDIKKDPDDFIVREITGKGMILREGIKFTADVLGEEEVPEGKFTTFVLQKKGWETIRALLSIAKMLRRGRKSIGYAGVKDRASVSTQLASIYGVSPADLERIRIKDISINGAWKSNGVDMGSNIGNSFAIRVLGATAGRAEGILDELDGMFPNYFDSQRFGYRLNNFSVGLHLIKGEFEAAVMDFLTNTKNERNPESVEARERLAERHDFREAENYFPRYLRNEIAVIRYMAQYDNYVNSLRVLPRGITLMFVHAVESLIFNAALENRVRENVFDSERSCGSNAYGFPDIGVAAEKGEGFRLGSIVGYDTDERVLGEQEKEAMETLGITKDAFKVKGMPELSMRGTYRPLLSPFKDLSFAEQDGTIALGFSIPSGAYATVLVNEVTKASGTMLEEIAPELCK